jgi:3-oxoadipate enol-lactonase
MEYVEINGGRIAYELAGPEDGEVVLLSHSLFFDHSMFAPLAELLHEAGYRTLAYDHRGQGASSRATREQLSVDALTEDAAALVVALGLDRVHAVGNSLGGFVTLRLAARHPELLHTVTAIGASSEEEHQLAAFGPLADSLGQEGGAAAIVEVLLHIMFGDTSLAGKNPVVDHWRSYMSELDTTIGDAAYQVIHRGRIYEELDGVKVPVLAIAGEEDHAYPQPISGSNIAAATGGREETVARAGHSVALEQPEIVAQLLLTHLKQGA